MGFLDIISFGNSKDGDTALMEMFPLALKSGPFIEVDVRTIYTRILTEVLERTHGIPEKYIPVLWDNCLASESPKGLISLLVEAMATKGELFLVFDPSTMVLKKADTLEESEMREARTKGQQLSGRVYVTFKEFDRTDLLKFYAGLDYCTSAALYKAMNVSKATQIKIKDLRSSVGLTDSQKAIDQAKALSKSMSEGKDILMDSGDSIENSSPDLTATKEAINLIQAKKALYLGMPPTWLGSDASKGLVDTGEGDARKVEQGLKSYYFSIIKPVVETMFTASTTFKSEDGHSITLGLEALKTFSITDEEFMGAENKTMVLNKLFNLPENAEGDGPSEEIEVDPALDQSKNPPARGGAV